MKLTLTNIDITKIKADAIVNAANTSLLGGGGVDGAIHRAGGKTILEECIKIRNKQGGCDVGEAVITSAGNLSAKFVIHTVGPVWCSGSKNEKELLKNCYQNVLNLALKNECKTVVFPNISTGIYRFPKLEAAKIAIETVKQTNQFEEIIFACFDKENYDIYHKILNQ